jgi:transposase
MEFENPNSRIVEYPVKQGITTSILKNYGIGIDCHSKFYQCCILINQQKEYGNENVLKLEFSFEAKTKNIEDGLHKAIELLGNNSIIVNQNEIHYTCESTGPYHRPLVLIWRGKPSIINPLLATPSRRKTDVLDAALLANYDITGMYPESYIASEDCQVLKQLINEKRRATKLCTQATNRIGNILTYFGNTIPSLGKVSLSTIRPIIEDLCNGRNVTHEGIFKKPNDYICNEIFRLYKTYDDNKLKKEELEKLSLQLCENTEFFNGTILIKGKDLIKLLCSAPGIGKITAIDFISEIMDISRFQNAKSLVAYCGFDPSLKVSAGKVTAHKTRKGNKALHCSLMRCAGVLLNHHKEYFGQWGYIIYKKNSKGGYKKACGAVARRLVSAMYYMWLKNEEFSYENYTTDFDEIENVNIDESIFNKAIVNKLKSLEINTTQELYKAFKTGTLFQKGIGSVTINGVEQWIKSHKLSKQKAQQMQSMNQ